MKTAEVRRLGLEKDYPDMEAISEKMDELKERIRIDTINWKEYDYKPDVTLALAYSDREIFLKYYVTEDNFKAEKTHTNDMVCEDSCVEFFVSPEDDGIYYNLEFNAIGTCLLGTGTGRENSTRANPTIISGIRRLASAGKDPFGEKKGRHSWTLTLAVPLDVFFHHDIKELKGKTFKANFYKCGDMLSVPHYVTWNPVGTEKPDYHQPKYFGLLRFI